MTSKPSFGNENICTYLETPHLAQPFVLKFVTSEYKHGGKNRNRNQRTFCVQFLPQITQTKSSVYHSFCDFYGGGGGNDRGGKGRVGYLFIEWFIRSVLTNANYFTAVSIIPDKQRGLAQSSLIPLSLPRTDH